MPSKLIPTISSYTVSTLVQFFETECIKEVLYVELNGHVTIIDNVTRRITSY